MEALQTFTLSHRSWADFGGHRFDQPRQFGGCSSGDYDGPFAESGAWACAVQFVACWSPSLPID